MDNLPALCQARLDQLFVAALNFRRGNPQIPLTPASLGLTPKEFNKFQQYLENTELIYSELGLD